MTYGKQYTFELSLDLKVCSELEISIEWIFKIVWLNTCWFACVEAEYKKDFISMFGSIIIVFNVQRRINCKTDLDLLNIDISEE